MASDHFNKNRGMFNYKVIGGIITPVSDAYGKRSLVSSQHRLEMCRLASENHPFVTVESWEATNPLWTPTLKVLQHFKAQLQADEECESRGIRLMLLIGSDLMEGLENSTVWQPESVQEIIKSFGLVVIERNPSIPLNLQIFTSNLFYPVRENIHIVPQFVSSEISSSKVRLLLERGFSIKYLTDDKVIDYILNNNLYNSAQSQ